MKTLRQFEENLFNKINPAIRFSVGRYVLSIGIFVSIVVFGIVSLLGLGVDLFPNINIPVVVVSTSYTGATPSVVDQQVTQVIENAVSTVSGITDMNASSSQGSSRVILSFDISVDKNSVANQVATHVSAAVRGLPTGAGTPIVRTFDPNSQPILEFGISGGATDLTTISNYATNVLAPQLERIDGVANVQIDGAPTRSFQVLLNP
ncbi:MAG TPA: efflux RND transporter permease subunit, partial [Spirochaetia bacterium]|nr:efflux RND transporter permease subunit [Spirochaetia bacterium]